MFSPPQLQQILLGYIPNPQLELVLVMFVVPFIVNVSGASASAGWAGLGIAEHPHGSVHRAWLGAALRWLGRGGGVCREMYLSQICHCHSPCSQFPSLSLSCCGADSSPLGIKLGLVR